MLRFISWLLKPFIFQKGKPSREPPPEVISGTLTVLYHDAQNPPGALSVVRLPVPYMIAEGKPLAVVELKTILTSILERNIHDVNKKNTGRTGGTESET